MRHAWNLFKWFDAVGIDSDVGPELFTGVQPVVILGDHSAHASPILAPVAWMGGKRTAGGVGTYGCFSLTSAAPGGTYVREIFASAGAANQFRWLINTSPGTVANVLTPVVQDMAPAPTVSRVVIGTLAAEPGTTLVPAVDNANVGLVHWVDSFYIRPGFTLQMWFISDNTVVDYAVLFEDCLALPGAS